MTPAELAAREPHGERPGQPGRRHSPEQTHIIEAYTATLQQAHPGYGGEAVLAAGETKRVVQRELKTAAQALEYALDFRPTKDPTRLHFRVITPEEGAAHPKLGGRPRKQAARAAAATQLHAQPQGGQALRAARWREGKRQGAG